MASTILTLLAVHGFRTTISALTSTQNTTTTTARPKYALIRSKKIVKSTTANGDHADKVRCGRPGVYRLVEVGREEGPESELGDRENMIDVWRRVVDGYEAEDGAVKERWTMKMPLDRELRQVVRDLRGSGSSQDEKKKPRRKKMKRKKDTTSGRTARVLRRRNSAMSDGEDERLQNEGSNTRNSVSSMVSMQASTTHIFERQRQRASAKNLLGSPDTTQTPVSSIMQDPYVSQSQRQRSRLPISSPPFIQPTMSPEQSANFVFGNPNTDAAASLLAANGNELTIRTVPQDGEHPMGYQGVKKRSSGVQFVSEQASDFTIKSKLQTTTRTSGSLGSKSGRYNSSTPGVKANGKKWIQDEEKREVLLDSDKEETEWEEGIHYPAQGE